MPHEFYQEKCFNVCTYPLALLCHIHAGMHTQNHLSPGLEKLVQKNVP